jgi:hypothetical protein
MEDPSISLLRELAGQAIFLGVEATVVPGSLGVVDTFSTQGLSSAPGILLGQAKASSQDRIQQLLHELNGQFTTYGQALTLTKTPAVVKKKKVQRDVPLGRGRDAGADADADPTFINLRDRIKQNYDKVMKDLRDNKCKTEHWRWWYFPTEHKGRSDDWDTFIRQEDRAKFIKFLQEDGALVLWTNVYKELIKLCETKNWYIVIGATDFSIINQHFWKFWDAGGDRSEWRKVDGDFTKAYDELKTKALEL